MTRDEAGGPAVIVHGLEMAMAAMEAGRYAGRLPTLLSAVGAGAYAGVGWWRALMLQAGATDHILDCGLAPGRALEALRVGQKRLILQAEPRIWADIAARAEACRATLHPQRPAALDLAKAGSYRVLAAWLTQGPDAHCGDTSRTFG